VARVALRNITKQFGHLQIFQGLNLDVADGELLCLLGPSGSGKTTLLRIIAGLERLDDGEIWVGDRRAFWEIAVPLARPAILAVGLLAFIFSWNEFFCAVILTRAEVTTLPFILPTLIEGHSVLWGDIAAIATIGAMPVIVLAFILRKYRVRGLSFGTLHE
jgi:predicted ABC-type transport system involved in lysophospholipase L1 biosynthesis ATPase subunit